MLKNILHKVCCQGSHFVLWFFEITSSTSAPSSSLFSSLSAPVHWMSHSGMFKLYQILEDIITKYAACMLSLVSRKWTLCFIKVHKHKSSVAHFTGLCRDSHPVSIFKEMHNDVTLITGHLPLRTRGGVQDHHPILTFHTLGNPKHT